MLGRRGLSLRLGQQHDVYSVLVTLFLVPQCTVRRHVLLRRLNASSLSVKFRRCVALSRSFFSTPIMPVMSKFSCAANVAFADNCCWCRRSFKSTPHPNQIHRRKHPDATLPRIARGISNNNGSNAALAAAPRYKSQLSQHPCEPVTRDATHTQRQSSARHPIVFPTHGLTLCQFYGGSLPLIFPVRQ